MRPMTSLEYSYMLGELQPLLGKHLRKFQLISENLYRMRIGESDLLVEPGVRLHITRYMEGAQEPDGLCSKIKKELENSRLIRVHQLNDDRVLLFEFEGGQLFFEMFAKGNIVLVRDGKALAALHEESWADREVRRGREYKPPKPSSVGKLEDALSDKYVISCMMKLPLGKEYAQEILSRLGIGEKTPGTELTDAQKESLGKEIAKVRKEAKPHLFLDGGKPLDFGLAPFSKYEDKKHETRATLSEALDEYCQHAERETPNPELEKLERRLEKQEQHLLELRALEKELKEKGDYVYAHYAEAEEILRLAKGKSPKEIEDALKKRGAKADGKEKTVEVEL